MKRATSVLPSTDPRVADARCSITLTREDRYRRRVAWQTDMGEAFLLDLAEATYLPDGAGLVLDGGDIVCVRAAAENLLEITAASDVALARIAWHIGNRHTPAEITEGAIYIQPDHVLAEMVRGLGGTVAEASRPFEPEGGAYGGHGTLEAGHHHGHGHGQSHSHDQGHHHDHGYDHTHDHRHT